MSMNNRWNWLKDRLNKINSNPARFAKDIGWQASRVYELFSGKTKAIPLDKIAKASAILGVSLDSMINFNSGLTNQIRFAPAEEHSSNLYSSEIIPEIDIYDNDEEEDSNQLNILKESIYNYNGNDLTNKNIRCNWRIPNEFLNELKIQSSNVYIIEAVGDSMEPTICSGDKLIIDTSIKGQKPSPAGIFAIWDGIGISVKRIELIPNTEPQQLKISSDNPKHSPYKRKTSECCIIGRVAGVIKRL